MHPRAWIKYGARRGLQADPAANAGSDETTSCMNPLADPSEHMLQIPEGDMRQSFRASVNLLPSMLRSNWPLFLRGPEYCSLSANVGDLPPDRVRLAQTPRSTSTSLTFFSLRIFDGLKA